MNNSKRTTTLFAVACILPYGLQAQGDFLQRRLDAISYQESITLFGWKQDETVAHGFHNLGHVAEGATTWILAEALNLPGLKGFSPGFTWSLAYSLFTNFEAQATRTGPIGFADIRRELYDVHQNMLVSLIIELEPNNVWQAAGLVGLFGVLPYFLYVVDEVGLPHPNAVRIPPPEPLLRWSITF